MAAKCKELQDHFNSSNNLQIEIHVKTIHNTELGHIEILHI